MDQPTKKDLRDQPAYSLAEGARYLKVAPATLRSWVVGRDYPKGEGFAHFSPLIHPPLKQPPTVSFWNLIEAHVLRSLRTEHGVSLQYLRQALDYAESELRIKRLLLDKALFAEGGRLLLGRYGELIELSTSGQIAMRRVFHDHLQRVEWDEWKFPVKLYPFVSSHANTSERPIAIDPTIAFGRPVVARMGISTAAIAGRIDAGETIDDLAADYDLSVPELEEAVLYERAA